MEIIETKLGEAEAKIHRNKASLVTSIQETVIDCYRSVEGLLPFLSFQDANGAMLARKGLTVAIATVKKRERLPPDLSGIIPAVCEYFDLLPSQLLSPSKPANLTWPRQLAVYLFRVDREFSYPKIGKRMHRDHTTVIHAFREAEKKLTHPSYQLDLEQVHELLKSEWIESEPTLSVTALTVNGLHTYPTRLGSGRRIFLLEAEAYTDDLTWFEYGAIALEKMRELVEERTKSSAPPRP